MSSETNTGGQEHSKHMTISKQLDYTEMVQWLESSDWAKVLWGYEQIDEYPGSLPIEAEPYDNVSSGIQEKHLDAIRQRGWVVKYVHEGHIELKPDPRIAEMAELKAELSEILERV